ncbi:MAG: gamma-glutamyltransferase family protein [Spirochaetales bacterium]
MRFASNSGYNSRRSPVPSTGGAVATSQPLATQAGVDMLRLGGTAADAAVAAAAVLQVTQPCSTGIGGDAFCLYFESSSGRVHALNGSGRSPAALDHSRVAADGFSDGLPRFHAHTVTVPGAAAAWQDTIARFGALSLSKVLEPARTLAEDGFPVSPLTSLWWNAGARVQLSQTAFGHELFGAGGRGGDEPGPKPGEVFRNPGLARVLARIAEHGAREVYEGETAERIVEAVRREGGVLSLSDLRAHGSEWVRPLSVDYRGVRVWECPPNGQGFAALSALNILARLDVHEYDDPNATHQLVECMRLAFADAACLIADPDRAGVSRAAYDQIVSELLSEDYARSRARLVDPVRAMHSALPGERAASLLPPELRGTPSAGDDTVYLAASDRFGNGCSFINSNFMGFGTGIVPEGCGFSLQNRGYGFSLHEGHPNALEPRKRPYHTIIPGMATTDSADHAGELYAVFGVMGGMMQPQGHLQVISRLVDYDLDPQAALDRPRFQLDEGQADGRLLVENGDQHRLLQGLSALGHESSSVSGLERYRFGLGQVIRRDGPVVWAGSDGRGDGLAMGDGTEPPAQ